MAKTLTMAEMSSCGITDCPCVTTRGSVSAGMRPFVRRHNDGKLACQEKVFSGQSYDRGGHQCSITARPETFSKGDGLKHFCKRHQPAQGPTKEGKLSGTD